MKFTNFYEDMEATPGASNNALQGNAYPKQSVLQTSVNSNELKEPTETENFIKTIEKETDIDNKDTETLLDIINKTINDWNRERNYNPDEIRTVLRKAIENKEIIIIKEYE